MRGRDATEGPGASKLTVAIGRNLNACVFGIAVAWRPYIYVCRVRNANTILTATRKGIRHAIKCKGSHPATRCCGLKGGANLTSATRCDGGAISLNRKIVRLWAF